jgi:hypothetical protein
MPLDEERRRRMEFMQRLYDEIDGSPFAWVDLDMIGMRMDVDPPWEIGLIVDHLEKAGLLEQSAYDGEVRLTDAGMREVEKARLVSEERSEGVASSVLFHVQGDAYGVQVGTIGSAQSVGVEFSERSAVEAFVRELRPELVSRD